MAVLKKGEDTRDAHEKNRVFSHDSDPEVNQMRRENDLIEGVRADPCYEPISTVLAEQGFHYLFSMAGPIVLKLSWV